MMFQNKFYTAVGNFRTDITPDGDVNPIVTVNGRDLMLDPQEMAVWTVLNWRLLTAQEVQEFYLALTQGLPMTEYRTLEDCLAQLVTRGLVSCGVGDTACDALYDLLAGLYVVPMTKSRAQRASVFMKMVLLDGVPLGEAWRMLRMPRLKPEERRVLGLARQCLLSTAELVWCTELGVTGLRSGEDVMDTLYEDADTTSENLPDLMRGAVCRNTVLSAVANLYLHHMVLFQRV